MPRGDRAPVVKAGAEGVADDRTGTRYRLFREIRVFLFDAAPTDHTAQTG